MCQYAWGKRRVISETSLPAEANKTRCQRLTQLKCAQSSVFLIELIQCNYSVPQTNKKRRCVGIFKKHIIYKKDVWGWWEFGVAANVTLNSDITASTTVKTVTLKFNFQLYHVLITSLIVFVSVISTFSFGANKVLSFYYLLNTVQLLNRTLCRTNGTTLVPGCVRLQLCRLSGQFLFFPVLTFTAYWNSIFSEAWAKLKLQ